MSERKANRLVSEASPYLRQHADNPVDWYPWGEEALLRARRENKPIFLSIGYSACHWCHVMEHESFENEEIAQIMNERFVCIKVDREERPDLDQIYMNVVQLMTGHGGWPMSVFLTPAQEPIFAGTYFPPSDRMGMPGFPRVLTEIAKIYRENPPDLKQQIEEVLHALKNLSTYPTTQTNLHLPAIEKACEQILNHHDPEQGGFGTAPKFPQSMALTLLLRQKEDKFGKAVECTLRKMAAGGIYDQLGGGFARYSVDERWLVPHFEKMLYDNALLSPLYFEAFQVTKDPFFREIGVGILNWVRREMTAPEGGFYSALDADSEGEEGKFYVWDPAEIEAVLGPEEGERICRYFGVDRAGNFEHGKSVLHVRQAREQDERFQQAKEKLFVARAKRIAPGLDDKILTSWNALMIRGFVKGFQVTGDETYLEAALKSAHYLLETVIDRAKADSGVWLLACAKGRAGRLPAYLDDYAFLTAAFLDLCEVTGNEEYLTHAQGLHDTLEKHFHDPKGVGYFFISDQHEQLIERPKTFYDHSIPAGNSVVLENLLRLSTLTGKESFRESALNMLESLFSMACQRPMGMTYFLDVCLRALREAKQIVLIEGDSRQEFEEMRRSLWLSPMPYDSVLVRSKDAQTQDGKRAIGGQATLYICQGRTCSEPLTSMAAFERRILETKGV